MRSSSGFTLIEILIYIGLITVITGSFIASAYQIIDSRGRVQNQLELTENKKFLVEKLKWILASNQTINLPGQGASGASLSVNKLNYGSNPLVVDLVSNQIRLALGGGEPVPLTNSQVTVSSLTFTHQDLSGRSVIRVQATMQNTVGSISVDTTIPVK
ncbi:MAG: type II secretion system protein [Candidatus Colwellbacteria bacterium]|nr:type II secretion system protein [Candidatus Colwellbacteria bacterium]